MQLPKYLSPAQAAHLLCISTRTLQRLVARGKVAQHRRAVVGVRYALLDILEAATLRDADKSFVCRPTLGPHPDTPYLEGKDAPWFVPLMLLYDGVVSPQMAAERTLVSRQTLRRWERRGLVRRLESATGLVGHPEEDIHDVVALRGPRDPREVEYRRRLVERSRDWRRQEYERSREEDALRWDCDTQVFDDRDKERAATKVETVTGIWIPVDAASSVPPRHG